MFWSKFDWRRAAPAATLAIGLMIGGANGQAPATTPPDTPVVPTPSAPALSGASAETYTAPKPEPTKIDLVSTPLDWGKVCTLTATGAARCNTIKNFAVEPDLPPGVIFSAAEPADGISIMRLLVPLEFLIPTGVGVALDGSDAMRADFILCRGAGCFVEAKLDQAALDRLKASKKMSLSLFKEGGKEFRLSFPLDGFEAAYDGAPTDVKIFEQQRLAAEAALNKRMAAIYKALGVDANGKPTTAGHESSDKPSDKHKDRN
jgi:invasion protein IalB